MLQLLLHTRALSNATIVAVHARPWIHNRAIASHGVIVYVPAFAGTRYTYTRRDGQAELIELGGWLHT